MATKNSSKSQSQEISSGARAQILDSFIELSYKSGARQVSHKQVADHSGLAYTTIHYHFPPKDTDIAEAAALHMFQKAYQYIDEQMYVRQKMSAKYDPLVSYIEVMFSWLQEKPTYASYLFYFYYLLTSKVETGVTNQAFLERAYLRIETLVHEAVGRGLYPRPKDIKSTVAQFHSVVSGTCLVAVTSRSKKVFEEQKDICTVLAKKIFG